MNGAKSVPTGFPCRRREFVGGLLATAAVAEVNAVEHHSQTPALRVGILSDIHCHYEEAVKRFEDGLRLLKDEYVDAVLIAGDLFTRGTIKELENVAAAWFRVFPNDRRDDGTKVERLFITGNHDEVDWPWKNYRDFDDMRAKSFRFNREEVWKRLWGEEYEKIRIKTVKGYPFVLRHWICRPTTMFDREVPAEPDPLPEFMKQHSKTLRRYGKPFFYVQHEPIDRTVNATWLFGGDEWDNGQTHRGEKAIFDSLPNCVVLTGHSHDTLTDEMSIWQGKFTAVNCSAGCGYIFSRPGRENGFHDADFFCKPPREMATFNHWEPRQALVMDVYSNRIVFKRLDIAYRERLGDDWFFPLFAGGATVPPSATPKYDFSTRKKASPPPSFSKDAKVSVTYVREGHHRTADDRSILDMSETHPQIRVSFPPVTRANSPSRAFEFRVTCESRTADIVNVAKECRVFSPKFCLEESRETEQCTCDFAVSALPKRCRGKIRFVVTPIDCWYNEGKAIASEWIDLDKMG